MQNEPKARPRPATKITAAPRFFLIAAALLFTVGCGAPMGGAPSINASMIRPPLSTLQKQPVPSTPPPHTITLEEAPLLRLSMLDEVPEPKKFADVVAHIGHGAPTEGPLFFYRDADHPDRMFRLWYAPIEARAEDLWAFDNLRLHFIESSGAADAAEVVWPDQHRGKSTQEIFKIFEQEHPELLDSKSNKTDTPVDGKNDGRKSLTPSPTKGSL